VATGARISTRWLVGAAANPHQFASARGQNPLSGPAEFRGAGITLQHKGGRQDGFGKN